MLNQKERELLDKITLMAIANGNTVNPKVYEPTPEEYKMLCRIRVKFGLD